MELKIVITDSFHGTIFSIIFNKPFISFKIKNDERFKNLIEIFGIKSRIIELPYISD
jgi:exopolysaccharide biosynthesis predicted pyruvyltransferase EpsI